VKRLKHKEYEMKRISLIVGVALALTLVVTLAWTQVVVADDGLIRVTWPSADNPGPPFYARIEPTPPYVFSDGEWAAIAFYRDPGCIPASFNLLLFFDPPAAFGCPLTVHGASLHESEALLGAPKIAIFKGSGAVPVWFVPVEGVNQALQDGVLTIGELAGVEGLLVGYADQFHETLHPDPLPPEFGGGGHQNSKLVLNAHGQLEDERQFHLHIVEVQEELQAIRIQFR